MSSATPPPVPYAVVQSGAPIRKHGRDRKHPTIPLSVTDLEAAGIPSRFPALTWLGRLLVLSLLAGACWTGFHYFMTQRSTEAALHRSMTSHEATRQDLYATRNRAVAAERREEIVRSERDAERTRFEEEARVLREALGPELVGVEAVRADLTHVENLRVTGDARRLGARFRPARLFARRSIVLSEPGIAQVTQVAEVLRPAEAEIWVEVHDRSRETATARGLAIASHLESVGLPASRIRTVARSGSRASIEIVLRP